MRCVAMILALVLASMIMMAAGDAKADVDQVNQVAVQDTATRFLTEVMDSDEESNETVTDMDDEGPQPTPTPKPSPKPAPVASEGMKLVPVVKGSATVEGDRDEICVTSFLGAFSETIADIAGVSDDSVSSGCSDRRLAGSGRRLAAIDIEYTIEVEDETAGNTLADEMASSLTPAAFTAALLETLEEKGLEVEVEVTSMPAPEATTVEVEDDAAPKGPTSHASYARQLAASAAAAAAAAWLLQ